jgi:6-pyruvoyl-tetrahydropterin synthase
VYRVTDGIYIHFGHHVRGHLGPCISIHGHTWLFQVTLEAKELDHQGFVLDFDLLHERVLAPCHRLLDHSLALGQESWNESEKALTDLGAVLYASREKVQGVAGCRQSGFTEDEPGLGGARNYWPSNMKVAVFPFTPTSERLAEWLGHMTQKEVGDGRVRVHSAKVVESLHPTESSAEFILE